MEDLEVRPDDDDLRRIFRAVRLHAGVTELNIEVDEEEVRVFESPIDPSTEVKNVTPATEELLP